MFILRIAGDVLGQKRNIEVTFPSRPSLQQICTVAETILPLQGGDDRRPWRPPGPLTGFTSTAPQLFSNGTADIPTGVPSTPAQRTPTVSGYVVETVVFVNPATRQWEAVYSAAQLSSGSQVYCFAPLQRHRLPVVAQPRQSASLGGHGGAGTHTPAVTLANASVVTEVREQWVNTDRPGAIPEPQQRLVWDLIAVSRGHEDFAVPRHRSSGGARRGLTSPVRSAAVDDSRNLSGVADDTALTASSPARLLHSASRLSTSHSPSALQPSYLRRGSSDRRESGRVQRRSEMGDGSGVVDHRYYVGDSSRLSSYPSAPRTSPDSYPTYLTPPYAAWDRSSSPNVISFQKTGWRSREWPTTNGDRSADKRSVSSASALLLLLADDAGGGQGERYAKLGERLALLFDVLVHLDAQDAGAERHYLLLRDFYLFTSYLAAGPATGAGRSGGSAVPPDPLHLTDELAWSFGLSWDDLLRHADQDRDGCISYREWIAFGIEHPDIIELLCRAVRRLPVLVNAAMKRLHPSDGVRSPVQSTPPPSATLADDLRRRSCSGGGAAAPSSVSSPSVSYPCRIHSDGGSAGALAGVAMDPLMLRDGAVAYWGRCEACRALAALSPEERRQWALAPAPFPRTLRQ